MRPIPEIQSCIGVELKVIANDVLSCRYVELSLHKDQLTIAEEKILEGDIKTVINALPKGKPMALVLNGKGVLLKTIPLSTSETRGLFNRAFPAIAEADFYVQLLSNEEQAHFAISRKEWCDLWIDRFLAAGIQLFTLSFTAVVALPILKQLNCYGDIISFDGHEFELSPTGELKGYRAIEKDLNAFEFKLDNHPIAAENIIAYAAGLQLLLHKRLTPIKAVVAKIDESFEQFKQNRRIKNVALTVLLSFFMLLLINFSIYSHYNGENEILVSKVGARANVASSTETLIAAIKSAEKQLAQLSWNGGYSYAFLVSELGREMPNQLTLSTIQLNTLESQLNARQNIKIAGHTQNLQALNNWLYVLKQYKWAREVKLLNYAMPEDQGDYEFTLNITYGDD